MFARNEPEYKNPGSYFDVDEDLDNEPVRGVADALGRISMENDVYAEYEAWEEEEDVAQDNVRTWSQVSPEPWNHQAQAAASTLRNGSRTALPPEKDTHGIPSDSDEDNTLWVGYGVSARDRPPGVCRRHDTLDCPKVVCNFVCSEHGHVCTGGICPQFRKAKRQDKYNEENEEREAKLKKKLEKKEKKQNREETASKAAAVTSGGDFWDMSGESLDQCASEQY